jgi:hypothetical protein
LKIQRKKVFENGKIRVQYNHDEAKTAENGYGKAKVALIFLFKER